MSNGAGAAGHSGIAVAAIFRTGIELTTPLSLKSGTPMAGVAGVAGPSAPPLLLRKTEVSFVYKVGNSLFVM